MGMMDNMKDSGGNMRERYDELCRMEEEGKLDDKGREELQQLREKFE